jgi:DNA-binding phage protein
MDINYNIEFTQRAYLQAKLDNADEESLALLLKFIKQNKNMLDLAQQQLQGQQMEQQMAQQEGVNLPTDMTQPPIGV